jgi:putative MATE family efflux protein
MKSPESDEAQSPSPEENQFLTAPLSVVFVRTAVPIALVMMTNGLFSVVDAAFLGHFVGADALAAVTLMFPVFMLLNALATLVSAGMSSILARRLGAQRNPEAQQVFLGAHALALTVCLGLIALFAAFGPALIGWISNGSQGLAEMGWTYMSILIFCAPLPFMLSLHSDALRSQGKIGLMTAIAASATLLNVGFNYLLIARLGLGVAGSAVGTVLAQSLALAAVLAYRWRDDSVLSLGRLRERFAWRETVGGWGQILALGAPHSLNLLGVSLGSTAVLYSVQRWSTFDYEATVGAYGIITRVMTFAFLPLLGLSLAFQTIVGNNFGAERWERTDSCLRIALTTAVVYCAAFQTTLVATRWHLAGLFVSDPGITAELARILPRTSAMFWAFGTMMMLTSYFQAIGDAPRAAIFGLTRTYAFSIPLTLLLPFVLGEVGIWYAGPAAEVLMIGLTCLILRQRARDTGMRLGLLRAATPIG